MLRKGNLATTPFKVIVKTTGDQAITMFKTYLLPVTVGSDFKVNQNLKTTYFLITAEPSLADYPDYDRAAWSIVDFSSQEANGEGPNNGRAIFTLDNNVNTFWHAQWMNGGSVLPHHITFDMGSVKTLYGINFTQRQISGSGGKANSVEIQTNLNNVNWTQAAGFHCEICSYNNA